MTGFYQVLGQSLEISEEDREKLMLLEAQATDESLSTVQRQLAMNEYQVLYQSLMPWIPSPNSSCLILQAVPMEVRVGIISCTKKMFTTATSRCTIQR